MKNKKAEQMIREIMAYNFMLFFLILLFVFFAVVPRYTGYAEMEIEEIATLLKHWKTLLAAWCVLNILFTAHVWYNLRKNAKAVKSKEGEETDISGKKKNEKWGMS